MQTQVSEWMGKWVIDWVIDCVIWWLIDWLRTSGTCNPYKLCNYNLYIRIITSSHITHNLQVTINLRKTFFYDGYSPGMVLSLRRLLHMLRHFDPPFSGLWKICIVSTPIFQQKWGKCRISTPVFGQNFDPPFWPFVVFQVNGQCWASLSETEPRPPPQRVYLKS